MEYNLRLDSFEGPLDLLVHLIEKNQMDISEISLRKVTQQYLDYLNQMEEMDLDVASEFLMLAAELVQLKTKTLLPGAKKKKAGPPPEPDLVKRLFFYRRVKRVTELLKQMEEKRLSVYERNYDHLIYFLSRYEDQEKQRENPLEGIQLKQVVSAFNRARIDARARKKWEKSRARSWQELEGETYTVKEKMEEILEHCRDSSQGFSFGKIIKNLDNPQEKVVSFLALLELIKSKKVMIERGTNVKRLIIKGGSV